MTIFVVKYPSFQLIKYFLVACWTVGDISGSFSLHFLLYMLLSKQEAPCREEHSASVVLI